MKGLCRLGGGGGGVSLIKAEKFLVRFLATELMKAAGMVGGGMQSRH